MITRVKEYIQKEQLFSIDDKLILAISGGADSICLMHILLELGCQFDLAHCNFKLRGDESNDDEKFVRKLASNYNIKLHCKSFNTQDYAENKKISTQMAARELRYRWLNEILDKKKAKYIVMAHHQDDAVETFFINLIRGSGLLGLKSISPKQDTVVRPLMSCTRIEIEKYLLVKKQDYKDDSSNQSLKYTRNKIRHKVLPLLKEINPSISKTIAKEIQILKESNDVFSYEIERQKKIINKDKGIICINIKRLQKLNPLRIYLFEFLKPFGFNNIDGIILALDGESGKKFYSKTHQLIIDRENIFISKIKTENFLELEIYQDQTIIKTPVQLNLTTSSLTSINKKKKIAQFDYDKLKFPLILRKWKRGDKFKPLGMKRYKKLSDFFIDNKFSQIEKNNQWLLCSENKIIWIIGNRIDERFKVGPNTKKLYIAEVLD